MAPYIDYDVSMKTIKLFSVIIILASLCDSYAVVCKSRFAQSKEECSALQQWNPKNFTHVEDLDRLDKFQIIFHSITGFGWSGESNPKPGSFNERILQDPMIIVNNPKISASLISESKHKTFRGYIGLILEAQPENIVATSFEDAGSPSVKSYSEDELFMLDMYSASKKVDIRTPKAILDQTVKYNEIVLTGTDQATREQVKPAGIIIRCSVKSMTRIDSLRSPEFESYLNSKCIKFSPEVVKSLARLRSLYPTFAYPLE